MQSSMKSIKTIIVDDEPAAVESLKIMLERYCGDLEVIASATSVKKAVKLIKEDEPELVFLDIMMSDGTGFDVLEKIPDRQFEVVFVTAYSQWEIKALKYSAIRYIQKPLSRDDLVGVVEAIKARKGVVFNPTKRYGVLFDNLREVLPKKLSLTTTSSYEYLDVETIDGFKFEEDKVVVFMTTGESMVVLESIDHLEDILDDRNFYRFSNDLLLNLRNIEAFSEVDVAMKGEQHFDISKSKIEEFKRRFGNPPY